jgi:hypothetical protein
MMNEQTKRMLKLMGLNEQSTFGTPSFDNLKIEKDIQDFVGSENLDDFFSDENNELLIEQLKKLFESETNDDLIQSLEDSNPTKITSILTRIKNDLAMKEVYSFLKEVKRRMTQQYLK